jgi:glyoxylase-like metal-dependent hydrolase (beta-lactamase superfamily II)
MATIDEVAPDIFRINLGALPGDPITTSFFLIRDDQPTLVETGYRKTFDEAWDAVSRLVDPTTLRYVVVPHLEGDESGALNHFLERAPNAQAVHPGRVRIIGHQLHDLHTDSRAHDTLHRQTLQPIRHDASSLRPTRRAERVQPQVARSRSKSHIVR